MVLLRKAVLPVLLATVACGDSSRLAMGEVNSIIVVAEDGLWSEVGDTVLSALQPRVFAGREEPTFLLTHTAPTSEYWGELSRFRQILAIGGPDDTWIRPALSKADTTVSGPTVVEADDVWAQSQRVTALVIPDGASESAAVVQRLDELAGLFDRRYRGWAYARMYTSGHDTALMDTLRREGGFAVDMPIVYRWRRTGDSAFMFLNDNPDASQLVRSLLVTWRTGTDGDPDVEAAVAWRDSVAGEFYDWGQYTLTDRVETSQVAGPGGGGLELRGSWSGTLDDFPQGGPFITRVIDCPAQDRRYLLDTWLYAPARDKYQYLIQLETLLDSFECAGAAATAGASEPATH
jgi:hypothetical protein